MLNTKKSINVLNWELKRKKRFLSCRKKHNNPAMLWSCDVPSSRMPRMHKCPFSEMKPNCFCDLNPKYTTQKR